MAYDLIGLACPYDTWCCVDGGTEQYARGAFHDVFTDGDIELRIDHNAERVIGRQSDGSLYLIEHEAGLYAALSYRCFRDRAAAAELQGLQASGKILGLSVSYSVKSSDREYSRDGRSFICTRVGKLFDVSLAVNTEPLLSSTWVAPHSPEALARIRREQVEAVEVRYGCSYIEGLSDRDGIESTVPYQGRLLHPCVRTEREFQGSSRSLLTRLVFQDHHGREYYA